MLTRTNVDSFLRVFKNISAFDAVDCLCTVFSATRANISIDGLDFTLVDLYDMPEIYTDILASDFYLKFFGGPPQGARVFQGTLYNMVVDHFMYAYTQNHETRSKGALAYVDMSHSE